MKWIYIGIGALVLAGLFFGSGITGVEVTDFKITDVASVGTRSLGIEGELTVSNPSRLSIPVSGVPYEIVVRETGELLARGTLDGFTLAPKQTVTVPLSIEFSYAGASDVLISLLTKEQVFLDVTADVRARPLGIPYTLTVTQAIDVKDELRIPRTLLG